MKTSIATVSISGNLEEKIDAIAQAGFRGIEIFEQDFIADSRTPHEVGARIRDAGLELLLFQPFRDFEGLPNPLRALALDRAEHKFDLMQELGCDLMLVCSTVHAESLGGISRAADDFAELGERAAKRGLRIGYEALAWGRHVNDHRDAWEVVRRADHPSVGLILDSFHTLARKIDPDTIRRIPGDKIFFVQLADAPSISMDMLYWSRHFRNMPGEGDLDVIGFMRAVMATGYAGPVSLEIFNDQFRGGPPKTIAGDGYRSLVALMDDVRRIEPDIKIDLPDIPERIRVKSAAFVEFATRDDEKERLEALLASMGFRCASHHVSKSLAVWQQGDIRIVVNAETKGHAHSTWLTRGTTVCDIGIEVASARDTLQRATAMGAKAFSQPLAPNEINIPAIRGLGGSLLHFLDQSSGLADVWSVEFSSDTDDTHSDAGLVCVDHLAQTMSYDQMLSWSLFYTTLFSMNKAEMVDVIDPDGLVRSQALTTKDGTFRITLNGAETHRTLAGGFLAETFGASVQHIALATDDIFATARALAARDFDPLPMPENYYADLAARFDLAPPLIAELRALNILYDRDEGGEFFQIYSQPFSGGMFFEIVERRGSYIGFGAPNAPFRIAAQKRLMRPRGMP